MKAEIKIIRDTFTDNTTIGKLYINNEFFCFTLEDAVRDYGVKVKGATAIPRGNYYVKISKSYRFKRDMPMVFTEPNGYELINRGVSFKGIRMHGGNTHKNTEGCILVAFKKLNDKTIQGTAERKLTEKLKGFSEIVLTIINEN